MKAETTTKAKTITIKASSRASVKLRDNFYTVEWTEERSVPATISKEALAKERKALWDTCNSETDNQVKEIVETFR